MEEGKREVVVVWTESSSVIARIQFLKLFKKKDISVVFGDMKRTPRKTKKRKLRVLKSQSLCKTGLEVRRGGAGDICFFIKALYLCIVGFFLKPLIYLNICGVLSMCQVLGIGITVLNKTEIHNFMELISCNVVNLKKISVYISLFKIEESP